MVFSRRHSRRVVREEARPALFCSSSSSSSSSNVLYLAIQYHYVYMLSLPTINIMILFPNRLRACIYLPLLCT
jgi:hypothetical protein